MPRSISPRLRALAVSLLLHLSLLGGFAWLGGDDLRGRLHAPKVIEVRFTDSPLTSAAPPQEGPADAVSAADSSPESSGTGDTRTPVPLPPEPLEDMEIPFDGRPGLAKLQLDIDAGGKVIAAIVLESSFDHRTERDAVERIRETRFRPGTSNGHPVATRFILEVRVAAQPPQGATN